MIQLTNASKRFGPKMLFDNVDWLVTTQERTGLVGANGTGKSTLLKVLAGLDSLDGGTLVSTKGISAGYLPQDGLTLSGRTVFNECLTVFAEGHAMEREIETLAHRISELDPASEEYRAVSERFHRVEAELGSRDHYTIDAQVGTVLSGLGFSRADWTRPTEHFSGGWQMRIALAKLLLEKPNMLLLDEPTNHLDLEARNWLEDYLKSYPYAFVLVSHDRYFLDVTIARIVEIWNRGIHFYSGGYSRYLELKTERLGTLEAAWRNQQARIQQLEAFISRFRYQATKAKQVQSRIKELERMERIEIPPEEKTIHFSFPQPKPSGRVVAEFRCVSKSYGENVVLRNVDFIVERGDRVALVGVNGAGKSTLIKLLAGIEPLSSGDYVVGHNVEPDYFAQDQYKELTPGSTLMADMGEVSPRSTLTELRTVLGCFLFGEDEVFKTIGVLSGGERNRYALARMLMQPSNFLLLDEPTNHLDIRAKDVLLESLREFSGTVVFVSHDRYFIDKLATRVFEVADGGVQVYPGNYEDYLRRKEGLAAMEAAAETDLAMDAAPEASAADASKGKRLNPIKLRQMQDRCVEIELEVARLEAGIAGCEAELADFKSVEETQRVMALASASRESLEALMHEWEELSRAVEENQ
jgi:ATP-binding cassette, subfamily F, member 3